MATDPNLICIEEASHGVAAHELGKRVVTISLPERRTEIENFVDWGDPPEIELAFGDDEEATNKVQRVAEWQYRIRRALKTVVAGDCGKHIAFNDGLISQRVTDEDLVKYPEVVVDVEALKQLKSDLQRAVVLAKQIGDSVDVRNEIGAAETYVLKLLKTHWGKVERVVEALMQHETLEGDMLQGFLKSRVDDVAENDGGNAIG